MKFSVSVVIPAFNVAAFIEKTINSAILQPEVTEVIVVDDGSADNTFEKLKALQACTPKLKVYKHENGLNKGRSASRNLGIQKATCPYIAFLDADDFYEADRFALDKQIFENDSTVEGTYNCVGFEFYRVILSHEKAFFRDNTLTQKVAPEDLFEALISCKYGYLHLNGITVKRDIFKKTGYFNTILKVTQDTDIIIKMALTIKMYPSEIVKPLAKRGIHDSNIFDKKEIYKKYNPILYEGLVKWSLQNQIELIKIDSILKYFWIVRYRENSSLFYETNYWIGFLIRNPKVLFSKLSVKYFPIIQKRKQLFPYFFH